VADAVVDASVVVTILLEAPSIPVSVLGDYDTLHAPAHVDVECLNALRGLLLGGRIEPHQFSERTLAISQLPINRHLAGPLLPRAGSLAYNASAYDAGYIALAEALAADLVTRDRRLADVPGVRCRVIVVD